VKASVEGECESEMKSNEGPPREGLPSSATTGTRLRRHRRRRLRLSTTARPAKGAPAPLAASAAAAYLLLLATSSLTSNPPLKPEALLVEAFQFQFQFQGTSSFYQRAVSRSGCCYPAGPFIPQEAIRNRANDATTSLASSYLGSADLDVQFGSSNSSGISWGEADEEEEDDYDDNADNDDFAKNSNQNTRKMRRGRIHEARVEELVRESDDEYKEVRRRNKWGAFANVTTKTELQAALRREQAVAERENAIKKVLAESSGVEFTVLLPELRPEDDLGGGLGGSASTADGLYLDEAGKVAIRSGSSQLATAASTSWFAEMDEELADEWRELTMDDSNIRAGGSGATAMSSVSNLSDNDEKQEDDRDSDATARAGGRGGRRLPDDVTESKGTLVVRDALSGVRVGSAGGWTLEVFPGDFVVHRKYGIGRFERTCLRTKTKLSPDEIRARDERRGEILTRELRKRKKVTPEEIQEIRATFGTEEDKDPVSNPQTTVLEITYADAVVHVPVDRAYRLSRYRDGNAVVKPRLSRVRGQAWAKAKQRVEENTVEMAQDVLALYATRETLQRNPFDPAKEAHVKEFEATFLFEPTPDQQKCFEDVENDMVWRQRPMDRLVCGDVGFGKTEVALRAMYRAVANGRQAALLAPTGVLAAQHYKNVVKRMTPFGVTVALLRGGGINKNTKQGRALRQEIATGNAKVVVGTHSLLANDVSFKDLGLLVVDEEQRFGVKQKERLKLICSGVDVLTLSATPIPRTLQMSLSGIRDTSTIRSPPPMRKPTKTYVQDYHLGIVEHAIRTELERGGQCYYVVPRISMLDAAQDRIQSLFPSIRIIQAHGRMQRNGAEENVADFAEGNHDILLATTVIENGVDIPSVNTIIVEGAEIFGMSTLYQLRGRVGRSDQQAYAFFLHRADFTTEQAIMRLRAIGELNELGSGFDVANRDLEIRGAGSLLGTEQSGLAAKVGFDLYMRMLKKSIRKLRGLDLPLVPRTNVLIPTDGTPDTFSIPESYIADPEERQREEGKGRLAESTAALVKLTNDWKDRFGPLPASLQSQLKTMHLHACTRRLGIDLVGVVSNGDSGWDCVLRSPGLRPRHWAMVAPQLPKGALPGSVSVSFPSRLTHNQEEVEIRGGSAMDLKALLMDESLAEERDDEEWDAMDKEELEAMKDISSVVRVKDMDEVDLELYPRIVVRDFGTASGTKSVDKLLKVLLPVAKVVAEIQQKQADEAKVAADLRQKQELLRVRKKQNEALESQRMGMSMYGDLL
jgi:superfamily II DNA or RNA helicase